MSTTLRMWRAVYVKELRERLVWAVCGAALLGLAFSFVIGQKANDSIMDFGSMWSQINLVTGVGAGIFSIALAFLQILPESGRDRWAFLVHRPGSRSVLFWGKVAAGLTLYVFSMLLPLLLAVHWISSPGNVAAPFEWNLTATAFSCVLFGLSLYAAALLAAIRNARWYGSRLFPITALLMMAMFAIGSAELLLVCTPVATALLLIVARAAFLRKAGEQRKIFSSRFILGFVLWLGAAQALMLVLLLPVSFFHRTSPSETTEYALLNDGRVVESRWRMGHIDRVTALDGRIIAQGPNTEAWLSRIGWATITNPPSLLASSKSESIVQVGPLTPHIDAWYLCKGLLLEYSVKDRVLIGAIGEYGYLHCRTMKEAKGARPFPTQSSATVNYLEGEEIVNDNGTLYRMDLSNLPDGGDDAQLDGLVPKIFFDPRLAGAVSITPASPFAAWLAVSPNRITAMGIKKGHYAVRFSVPLDRISEIYNGVYYGVTSNYLALNFSHQTRPGVDVSGVPMQCIVFDQQGKIVQRSTLPTIRNSSNNDPATGLLLGVLYPVLIPIQFGEYIRYSSYRGAWSQIAPVVRFGWSIFGMVLSILTGVITVAAVSRKSAFTRARTVAWLIGAVFGGIVTAATLLSLYAWPAHERCRQCGKMRVVTREACEHCGSTWPSRDLDGTEIFDDPLAVPSISRAD